MTRKMPVGKPFQKGVSGNPGGQPKLSKELRDIPEFTNPEMKRIISKYFRMKKEQIVEAGQSDKIPMIEVAIARTIHVAAKNGDLHKLTPLIDRVCGKIKETLEPDTSGVTAPQIIVSLPDNGRQIQEPTKAKK